MPGPLEHEPIRGFTGKIPVRGDFVHAGLPRDFTDPWHDWQASVIAASREIMHEHWLDAFLEAPVWRFALAPGLCGKRAVVGLMLPSVDRVGRYFPLTFAALPDGGTPSPAIWSAWLDQAEALGRLALDEDAPPEQLMPPPCPTLSGAETLGVEIGDGIWWTEGGPRVAPVRLILPALPDGARFASMLGHIAPVESTP